MSFEKGYALVIGVGSYLHKPKANIPVSVADAQQVRDVLCNPNLCGYLPERVPLLHDETASRDSILGTLDKLANQTTAENTVLLYYCGHGTYGTDSNYYLTTYDTQTSGNKVVKGTGISEAELLDKLRAIPAKRLILLFNACHSGEISPQHFALEDQPEAFGDMSLPSSASDAILSSGEGRIIITASRPEQKSWIGTGKLSIFTQALVDGLSGRGYVPNNNGYISAFGLYEHMYISIKETAGKLGKVQEPELTVLKGVGPFPLSLYRGATDLGSFDDQESLPEDKAARAVDPVESERQFNKIIKTMTATLHGSGAIAQGKGAQAVGARGVIVGGNVGGSIVTGNDNDIQTATGRNIAQAAHGGRATVTDNSRMTMFDQRGQHVNYQYNAGGDINFGAVQNKVDVIAELEKLRAELAKATEAGAVDEEVAADVESKLKKAIIQAKKPEPDKKTVLDYLNEAKALIEGVAAAGGLVTALVQAAEVVRKFF